MTSAMMRISGGLAEATEMSLSQTAPWSTSGPGDLYSSPSNLHIGNRLRLIRESHGISEKEFSVLLGIDCKDLGSYESGGERVSASLLLRIAKLLDVRPDYFFQDYAKGEV